MDRRSFLKAGALLPAAAAPGFSLAQQLPFQPKQAQHWRMFEVTTRVDVLVPGGTTKVWLPVPSVNSGYQKVVDNAWSGNAHEAKIVRDGKYGANMLYAEWPDSENKPYVELHSRFATRDRAVDFGSRLTRTTDRLGPEERQVYTAPTEHIPLDGIVLETAREVTKGTKTDYEKAKAIYDWIVDNTFRDPKVRGCGTGDIKAMLETGNLGGKCADLNALYVGLARASGLPARDVYGVRVAKSQFGYRSLGAGTENITRAQHCRAEVYLEAYGWVPVDPADVRKVVLEEPPGNLAMNDPKVVAARKRLFGGWEMNYLAYNMGHDVHLPHATRATKLPYLMYTNAEADGEMRDQLDPESLKYAITAREIRA